LVTTRYRIEVLHDQVGERDLEISLEERQAEGMVDDLTPTAAGTTGTAASRIPVGQGVDSP
jgi:hypothetical protein